MRDQLLNHSRRSPPSIYRVVQLNLTPEIKICYIMFERSLPIFSTTSLKHHIEYFHFRCKIQLDLPVEGQNHVVCTTDYRARQGMSLKTIIARAGRDSSDAALHGLLLIASQSCASSERESRNLFLILWAEISRQNRDSIWRVFAPEYANHLAVSHLLTYFLVPLRACVCAKEF